MAPKRKRSTVAAAPSPSVDHLASPIIPRSRRTEVPLPSNVSIPDPKPQAVRRRPSRGGNPATVNPDTNPDILDGVSALRASPDGHGGEFAPVNPALKPRPVKGRKSGINVDAGALNGTSAVDNATTEVISAMRRPEHGRHQAVTGNVVGGGPEQKNNNNNQGTDAPSTETAAADLPAKRGGQRKKHVKVEDDSPAQTATRNVTSTRPATNTAVKIEEDVGVTGDPEVDNEDAAEDDDQVEAEIKEASLRPPPVNSDYLPLPWKGRLGYVRILEFRIPMRKS